MFGILKPGTAGNDLHNGTANDDILMGGAGLDTLNGGAGKDMLFGDAGADVLNAGAGDDLMYGGDGADKLFGGLGADIQIGGAGADTFRYTNVLDSQSGATDLIADFEKGVDKLDLSSIDANLLTAGNDKFTLVDGWNGTDPLNAGEIGVFFDAATGKTIVEGNTDGGGANNFHTELTGNVVDTATDIIF